MLRAHDEPSTQVDSIDCAAEGKTREGIQVAHGHFVIAALSVSSRARRHGHEEPRQFHEVLFTP
jgi:hypothetical protein